MPLCYSTLRVHSLIPPPNTQLPLPPTQGHDLIRADAHHDLISTPLCSSQLSLSLSLFRYSPSSLWSSCLFCCLVLSSHVTLPQSSLPFFSVFLHLSPSSFLCLPLPLCLYWTFASPKISPELITANLLRAPIKSSLKALIPVPLLWKPKAWSKIGGKDLKAFGLILLLIHMNAHAYALQSQVWFP